MGPQADKHLPPSPFTGKFFRKADIQAWNLLVTMPLAARGEVVENNDDG